MTKHTKQIICFFFFFIGMSNANADSSTQLLFKKPAVDWHESIPLGNGRLGAMILGNTDHERIVLNEQSLWSGGEQDADRPDAFKYLPDIQNLLIEGKNLEAQNLLQNNFTCAGPGTKKGGKEHYGSYETLGDLKIDWAQNTAKVVKYERSLNLENAVGKVKWLRSDGSEVLQEAFTSFANDVFVLKLVAKKTKLNFIVSLYRKENATTSAKGNTLKMSGSMIDKDKSGMRYSAVLKVSNFGGSVQDNNGNLAVANADSCILIFSAVTNYNVLNGKLDNWSNVDQNASVILSKFNTNKYEAQKAAHISKYTSYFRKCRLNLTAKQLEVDTMSTPERLVNFSNNSADAQLPVLYFNFGRYLLISSSRAGGLPANLQGLWAEEYQTPWNGDYHLNINIQMNYWLSELTGLSELAQPLHHFTSLLVPNGKKTAKAYYNAQGWVAHVVTNPWHFTSPGEGANWGSTLTGGAWLCEHIWEHYRFTSDKKFLARYYPVLKGAAQFLKSILITDPKTNYLVTAPSNSPEHAFVMPDGTKANTCMGPTIDMQICRELFGAVIKSSEILKTDAAFANQLRDIVPKLAPSCIGKEGDLNEWLEDWKDNEPHHRHISHLYGLHPYDEITPWDTPELAKAAEKTLKMRGDDGTGWSLAWKINFWARLGRGDDAQRLLNKILTPMYDANGLKIAKGGGSYPNLFDAHPPFQIDGNFGTTSGIAEMLLQSHGNEQIIRILPALPSNADWQNGTVTGLNARGGFVLNFIWKDGKFSSGSIISQIGTDCKLFVNQNVQITDKKGIIVAFGKGLLTFGTKKGMDYIITQE
ncbi:MAG: glycoside hydrolase family 95 protein [Paludibacter sp.]